MRTMTCAIEYLSDVVRLWQGSPDSQALHDAYVRWLADRGAVWLDAHGTLTNSRLGNLGEGLVFYTGQHSRYSAAFAHCANAFSPWSAISASEVDIMLAVFGGTPDEDFLVVQEVKTTAALDLELARELVNDYDKLFGENQRLLLAVRVATFKNVLEFTAHRPDLALRLAPLARSSPSQCTRVHLHPTLVHETAADSRERLLAVRSTLLSWGWGADRVEPWSIALDSLGDRMVRIAKGQK